MSKDHTKYYNSKGEQVPSVTSVLKLYNKDLDGWANYMGLRGIRLASYLKEKAELGTYVHSLMEQYFSPDLIMDVHPNTSFITQSDFVELKSRFRYIEVMLLSMGFESYKTEYQMHGEKYGGTADIIFHNPKTHQYILLDLKTSKSLYATMYMQLMAYCQLLLELYGVTISKVAIILITRDMDDPDFLKFYDTNSLFCQRQLQIFNQILNIYYLLDDTERKKLLL